MSTFGAAYRQDVKNTNSPEIAATEQGVTSKLSLQGKQVKYADPTFTNANDRLVKGLVDISATVLSKKFDAAKAKETAKAQEKALTLGAQDQVDYINTLEDSDTLLNKFFGMEDKVITSFRTAVAKTDALQRTASLPKDPKQLAEAMTQEDMTAFNSEAVKAITDQYQGNPELQQEALSAWAKEYNNTLRKWAGPRLAYERERTSQSQMNHMRDLSTSLQQAYSNNDPRSISYYTKELEQALDNPVLTQDELSNNVTSVAKTTLEQNNPAFLNALKQTPVWDKILPEDKANIDAFEIKYEQDHNKTFLYMNTSIAEKIKKATNTKELIDLTDQIGVHIQAFSELTSGKDLYNLAAKQEAKIKTLEKTKQENIKKLNSGRVDEIKASIAELPKVFKDSMRELAKIQLLQGSELTAEQKLDITPEMEQTWLDNNPQMQVPRWTTSGIKSPDVMQRINNLSTLIQQPVSKNKVEEQAKLTALLDIVDYLRPFKATNPTLFADHAGEGDKNGLATIGFMDLIDSELTPNNILAQYQQLVSLPDIKTTGQNFENSVLSVSSESVSSFVSRYGQANPWTATLTNRNPSNELVLKAEAARLTRELLPYFKGNPAMTQSAVIAGLHKGGLQIENKFYPGLNRIQKTTQFSIPDYLQGLQASSNFREALDANHFPPMIDIIESPDINFAPTPDGQIVMSWSQGKRTVSMVLPVPRDLEKDRNLMVKYKEVQTNGLTLEQIAKRRKLSPRSRQSRRSK